jgi:chromosome partitioning protein
MVDTLALLLSDGARREPLFRCVLTQTTRDSVVAKHIRSELVDAGFPVLEQEMTNRVIYPEAALWGATPSMMEPTGSAAREIAAIASEVDRLLDRKQAAGYEKEKPPQSHDQFA